MPATKTSQPGSGNALADVIAVLAVALSSTGQAISMATLIFAGSLDAALPRAVSTFVVAAGVFAIYLALRSQIVPVESIVQDAPAIVLVAVAAGIVAGNDALGAVDVFAMLAATTLIAGVVMWAMGWLRLGGLVRYMPTTVIGAFMAGTGWLLAKGGLDVMVGRSVGIDEIGDLFTSDLAKFWVPGMIVGAVATAISRSDRFPPAALGLTVLLCTVGFYVVVAAGSSVDAVEEAGWLIGPFPDGSGPSIVTPAEITDAAWGSILGELAGIVSVIAISVVVALLNVTGIAAAKSIRVDVDAELRVAGESNILASVLGAAPGFHGVGDTFLLERLKASKRIVPVAAGVLMILLGALGVSIIGYVPRVIVGALLVTVGSSLLIDWATDLLGSVSRIENALSIGIVIVMGAVGVLEGIGVGLVAACAIFIVRYSRVDPIRSGGRNPGMRSRVDRSPEQVRLLDQRSERLAVFELQGYLFFGSLTQLDNRFRGSADLSTPTEPKDRDNEQELIGQLDAVVLDFTTVTGIDTSGYELIGRLVQELGNAGALVVLSTLDDDLKDALLSAVPDFIDAAAWASTLDRALERVEDHQLHIAGDVVAEVNPRDVLGALCDELDPVAFAAGEIVVEQGTASDGMFIIEDGTMTAFRVDREGGAHRLRRFGAGAMVGEIGMVTGSERSAQVVAETDVAALWLSNERYAELREQNPERIFELHEYIMQGQAARVISLSQGLTRG